MTTKRGTGQAMADRRHQRRLQMPHKPNRSSRKPLSRPPNICVYCGSNTGKNPAYVAAAKDLGRQMAAAGVGLVYGGGGGGLIGGVARAGLGPHWQLARPPPALPP